MDGQRTHAGSWPGGFLVGVACLLMLTGGPDAAPAIPGGPSAPFGGVVDLSTAGELSLHADVATDPMGTATVVWDAVTSAGSVVQALRLTVAEGPGPIQALSLSSTSEGQPRVVVDPSGNSTVVWIQKSAAETIIQARRIAPDGTLGVTLDLSPAGERAGEHDVAVDLAGNVVVVWAVGPDFFNRSVQARRISAAGVVGALIDVFQGAPPPLPFVVTGPRVGVDANGAATVVWGSATDCCFGEWKVNARRVALDESLDPVLEVLALAKDTRGGGTVRIAVGPDGTATALVRTDFGPGELTALLARRFTPAGVLGTAHTVSSFSEGCADAGYGAGVSAAGRTTLVWGCIGLGGSDLGVRARQIDADDLLGPVLDVSPGGAGSVHNDDAPVAVDGTGLVTAVWLLQGFGTSLVQARQISPDGQMGNVVDVATFDDPRVDGPRAAVDPTGLMTVVWTRTNQVSSIIQASQGSVPVFADVIHSHPARPWIEALFSAGVTRGCDVDPLRYCPDAEVGRDQIAVLLLKGIHGAAYRPPPATGTLFTDVPATHPFADWIEQLTREGIAGGCGGGMYCPGATLTRGQLAVFLLRAKHGAGYDPPAATGTTFTDVPTTHPFAEWIEQLALEGITGGCGPGTYCPDGTVTRAQIAVLLVRTFDLPL